MQHPIFAMQDTKCAIVDHDELPLTASAPIPVNTRLFGGAVCVLMLSLFASQPLVGVIGPALGLQAQLSGFVPLATLLGYGLGLVLIVPLSDMMENRRLALTMLAAAALAQFACAFAPNAVLYLIAALVLGAALSCIQVLVPLAAALTPEAERGRVVGDVMSGMMIGLLLSRPLAGFAAATLGWRGMLLTLALLLAILFVVLWFTLPRRRPAPGLSYAKLLSTLWSLLREERVLRLRAASAFLMFAAFNAFWTTVALLLARPPFHFGEHGIALFALAGASGIVVAPLAGRWGDRGHTRPALAAMHAVALVALLVAGLATMPAVHTIGLAVALLVLAALLLDVGTVADQTLGRRAVNLLRPEARGRINGLFTGVFFAGGSLGAALTGFVWTRGGWSAICILAGVFVCAALAISLSTLRDRNLG